MALICSLESVGVTLRIPRTAVRGLVQIFSTESAKGVRKSHGRQSVGFSSVIAIAS